MPRIQYMGGHYQRNMAEQRNYENSVQGSDMMDLVAQSSMMAAQLARQVSRPPPPYYNLPETFSGLSLGSGQTRHKPLDQPRTWYSSPCPGHNSYPVPPPATSQAFTTPDTQHMPSSTLPLFPSTTIMS